MLILANRVTCTLLVYDKDQNFKSWVLLLDCISKHVHFKNELTQDTNRLGSDTRVNPRVSENKKFVTNSSKSKQNMLGFEFKSV